MGKSLKNHILDRLGNIEVRKLLIGMGLRGIIIRRDFYVCFGYRLPVCNPRTFNEKINWVKLYRKDRRMATLTDKAMVRDYGKIYFGEMTFTPANGTTKFRPREWDEKLGLLSK